MKNPYEVLGVAKFADPDSIKKAYYTRAKALHPDVGGSSESFDELCQAFALLNDPDARYHYDQTGEFPSRVILHSFDAVAWNTLMEHVAECVVGDEEPHQIDLIARLTGMLERKIGEGETQVKVLLYRRGRIEKVIPRMKRKAASPLPEGQEDDLMNSYLRAQLDQIDRAITNLNLPLTQLRNAKNLLLDYEFEPDRPFSGVHVFAYGGNGTNG